MYQLLFWSRYIVRINLAGFYESKTLSYQRSLFEVEYRRVFFDTIINTRKSYSILNIFLISRPIDERLLIFKELLTSIFK
jgi:hypothetical protein